VLSSTGATLAGRTVTWTSGNDAVATVSAAGVVSAVSPGTVSITATSEGRTGSATLTVTPVPVANITVALAQSSVTVGTGTVASATLRSGSGDVLSGRTITWSSSSTAVATVNDAGVITTFAPGATTITATSEGRTGSATLTVTPVPIASVTIEGTQRIKAGDTYQYTAIARLANGTVVQRPLTWRIAEPARGAISSGGALIANGPGALTLQAVIDGVVWEVSLTVYDWRRDVIAGSVFESLAADRTVTNRNGQSEFPELVFVCSSTGNFFAWVSLQRFVTANGVVAFSFDGGQPVGQTWTESDNFNTLFKPGLNPTVKSFALQVAASRRFGFAFGEFRGPSHATEFRVTGLSPLLADLFGRCPSGNPIVSSQSADESASVRAEMRSLVEIFAAGAQSVNADRRDREATGPSSDTPSAGAWRTLESPASTPMTARRRP
jgi:hypothetical protein